MVSFASKEEIASLAGGDEKKGVEILKAAAKDPAAYKKLAADHPDVFNEVVGFGGRFLDEMSSGQQRKVMLLGTELTAGGDRIKAGLLVFAAPISISVGSAYLPTCAAIRFTPNHSLSLCCNSRKLRFSVS